MTHSDRVHDYSVRCYGDTDAILQVDLAEGQVYLYHRATVLKTHSLFLLHRYSSENLTLNLDFLDGELQIDLLRFSAISAILDLLGGVFKSVDGDVSSSLASGILLMKDDRSTIRCQVDVRWGFFTYVSEEDKKVEHVVELWADVASVEAVHDHAFCVSTTSRSYTFSVCPEDHAEQDTVAEWIQAFSNAMLRPRTLTEDDVAVSMTSCVDGGMDQVDSGNTPASSSSSSFFSFFDRKAKKQQRPRTDDEEYVFIELVDVLKCRAEKHEEPEEHGLNDRELDTRAHDKADDTGSEDEVLVHQAFQESEKKSNVEIADNNGSEKSSEVAREKHRQSTNKQTPPGPPLSGPPPPPPPPPPPNQGGVSLTKGYKVPLVPDVRLKQARWSSVPSEMIANSLWSDMKDVTQTLDLLILKKEFFVKKSAVKAIAKAQSSNGRKTVLLDHTRVQILGIVFGRSYSRVVDRLRDAITSTTEIDEFKLEKIKAIKRLVPTDDDRKLYAGRRADEMLPVDVFMLNLCTIRDLEARIDLTVNLLAFPRRMEECVSHVLELRKACVEVKSSASLKLVLSYLWSIGNYLNAAWFDGYGDTGFQVSSVDKVIEVKNVDTGFTVLDFLVQQIRASRPELLRWSDSFKTVPKCVDLSVAALEAEVKDLKMELSRTSADAEELGTTAWNAKDKNYFEDVKKFVSENGKKVSDLQLEFSLLRDEYMTMLEYLGESRDRKSNMVFSAIADFMRKFNNVVVQVRT